MTLEGELATDLKVVMGAHEASEVYVCGAELRECNSGPAQSETHSPRFGETGFDRNLIENPLLGRICLR